MKRKNQPQISAAMTAAGVLTTHWSLLDQRIRELGGQPEDLYSLGRREDSEIIGLVNATAEKLVGLGNEARAARQKAQPVLVPPQLAFSPKLQPLHLFLINKSGADAPTILSAMEGTYFLSPHARGMMGQTQHFVIGPSETALVGVFSAEQLGVTGWLETEFFGPKGWEHIKQFGLMKCLPDDGPYVRIAHPEQELGEWFRVGHDPVPFGGCSDVWFVGRHQSHGRYLDGWYLLPSRRLLAGLLLALRLAR